MDGAAPAPEGATRKRPAGGIVLTDRKVDPALDYDSDFDDERSFGAMAEEDDFGVDPFEDDDDLNADESYESSEDEDDELGDDVTLDFD